jgi:ankyrin repeat protein
MGRACVQTLLEAGADVNARTLGLYTPMHLAAKRGREDVARLLIEYGANTNTSAKLTTPLHVAAKYRNARVAKILIDNGANLEAKNANRKTAMMFAIENKDRATENALAKAGAFAPHLQLAVVDELPPETQIQELTETTQDSKSGSTLKSGSAPGSAPKFSLIKARAMHSIRQSLK